MGLVISQFSTFLDHVDCDSRGLVALAAFVSSVVPTRLPESPGFGSA